MNFSERGGGILIRKFILPALFGFLCLVLKSVVQGYFNYHPVPGNIASLKRFRLEVTRRWLRALRRRGQKHPMTWDRLQPVVAHWLPLPKILHPYPNLRVDAKHAAIALNKLEGVVWRPSVYFALSPRLREWKGLKEWWF